VAAWIRSITSEESKRPGSKPSDHLRGGLGALERVAGAANDRVLPDTPRKVAEQLAQALSWPRLAVHPGPTREFRAEIGSCGGAALQLASTFSAIARRGAPPPTNPRMPSRFSLSSRMSAMPPILPSVDLIGQLSIQPALLS